MALIYSAIASLDGYVSGPDGAFAWGMPDEEVHAAVNDLHRGVGTYLYGRKLYEVMAAWETMPTDGEPAALADFAELWRAAEKVVVSASLAEAPTARTRIARAFDIEEVRALSAAGDVTVGGPELAAQAFAAGLVDEVHLFLFPVVVGGGHRALPDGAHLDLELVGTDTYASGVVHLHHRVRALPATGA